MTFKRGMYIDRTTGDMWCQYGTDAHERWSWVNGSSAPFWPGVPKDNLDWYGPIPDWY